MRVLFIALEFPPLNNTGVHRSAKLAKYLPELGIEPIVITMDAEDSAKSFSASLEPGLLDDLPKDLSIYPFPTPLERTRSTRLGQFLRIWTRAEDSFASRIHPALSRALPGIVARHRPAAVYVSMPPFSAGRLAASVARDFGLPLVVDMRDGWSHWCVGGFPTFAHWSVVRARERAIFEQAAAVVTVTEQLANVFRRTHPHIPKNRFHVIPNGYDGALEMPDRMVVPARGEDSVITIGYVGRFYYSPETRATMLTPWWRRPRHRKLNYVPAREDWLYRSPHFFLRALAELKCREPALGKRIRFSLIGEKPSWLDAMVAEHGLEDAVNCMGQVPNAEVAAFTRSLDAQLCTSVKVEGGEDYALASKTFDYVRAGRPILGFVTRGSQREFLERSGMALLADPDDLDAGVKALAKLAVGGFTLHPDREFLAGFHRRALAERMANVIRAAAGESPKPSTTSSLREHPRS